MPQHKGYIHKVSDDSWFGYSWDKGYEKGTGIHYDRAALKETMEQQGYSPVISDGSFWHPNLNWVLSPRPKPFATKRWATTPKRRLGYRTNNVTRDGFVVPRINPVMAQAVTVTANIPEHHEVTHVPAATLRPVPTRNVTITYACGHKRVGKAFDATDAAAIKKDLQEIECPSCISERIDTEANDKRLLAVAVTYSDKWRND